MKKQILLSSLMATALLISGQAFGVKVMGFGSIKAAVHSVTNNEENHVELIRSNSGLTIDVKPGATTNLSASPQGSASLNEFTLKSIEKKGTQPVENKTLRIFTKTRMYHLYRDSSGAAPVILADIHDRDTGTTQNSQELLTVSSTKVKGTFKTSTFWHTLITIIVNEDGTLELTDQAAAQDIPKIIAANEKLKVAIDKEIAKLNISIQKVTTKIEKKQAETYKYNKQSREAKRAKKLEEFGTELSGLQDQLGAKQGELSTLQSGIATLKTQLQ